MATRLQLTAIAAGLGEHGVKGLPDRPLRLAVISDVIGTRVTTMNDLMREEASWVIEAIKRDAETGQLTKSIERARAGLSVAR
jgi:hypothetical protein